jgi:ABC-type multidrug transport system fused ATPase/permease subunit
MFIGLIFEVFGLGLFIPILAFLVNPEKISNSYPFLKNVLNFIGNPNPTFLIIYFLVFLILFYIIKALFLVYLSWIQGKITTEITLNLSNDLFEGYLKQNYLFHLANNSTNLFKNINTEVAKFSQVIYTFLSIILESSLLFGIFAILLYQELFGALGVGVILFLFSFLYHSISKKKISKWGNIIHKNTSFLYKHLMQGLNGVKEVKLLGRELFFLNQFNIHNKIIANVNRKNATLGTFPRLYFEILAVIGLSAIIIIMILQGKPIEHLIPTVGLFVAAAFRMLPSITRIMNSIQIIKISNNSIDILYDEFKSFINYDISSHSNDSITFNNNIKLHNIGFSYNNSKFIEGLNLTIIKGETIGFIGQSGSGKSTIIDILLGLLKPKMGKILVDDKNVENNLRSWQDKIGYVPQTIFLTDDTLINNIAFGIEVNEIDNEKVLKCIQMAQLEEFIDSLPLGLHTFVGERGVRLSGGQRQRIGIARALYTNPEVLFLDEATSALDVNTEEHIMNMILQLKGEKTIIIVAHRHSTVKICDKIFKINHGKIIQEGHPNEILN